MTSGASIDRCRCLRIAATRYCRSTIAALSGYGKKYPHAADRERSGDKQNDLTDAVRWAVDEGIADPARVAIDGFSFGGYAALAGAAFTPHVYCCAIDMCGPSNLLAFAANRPAYAGVSRGSWSALVGDPDCAEWTGSCSRTHRRSSPPTKYESRCSSGKAPTIRTSNRARRNDLSPRSKKNGAAEPPT